jgi:hypothetical protein
MAWWGVTKNFLWRVIMPLSRTQLEGVSLRAAVVLLSQCGEPSESNRNKVQEILEYPIVKEVIAALDNNEINAQTLTTYSQAVQDRLNTIIYYTALMRYSEFSQASLEKTQDDAWQYIKGLTKEAPKTNENRNYPVTRHTLITTRIQQFKQENNIQAVKETGDELAVVEAKLAQEQVIKQHKWDSLTKQEQNFLEEGVWASLDEAYANAIVNRSQEILSGSLASTPQKTADSFTMLEEKSAHIVRALAPFNITEDDWVASEEEVRYFMRYDKRSKKPITDCIILLLLDKLTDCYVLTMDSNTTTRIKRLTELLILGRINIEDACELINKGELIKDSFARQAFNSLTNNHVESLKLIDWATVTGVPFDLFPENMTVEAILALPEGALLSPKIEMIKEQKNTKLDENTNHQKKKLTPTLKDAYDLLVMLTTEPYEKKIFTTKVSVPKKSLSESAVTLENLAQNKARLFAKSVAVRQKIEGVIPKSLIP